MERFAADVENRGHAISSSTNEVGRYCKLASNLKYLGKTGGVLLNTKQYHSRLLPMTQ